MYIEKQTADKDTLNTVQNDIIEYVTEDVTDSLDKYSVLRRCLFSDMNTTELTGVWLAVKGISLKDLVENIDKIQEVIQSD